MWQGDDCIAVTDDFDVSWNSFGRGFERDAAKQMLSRLDEVADAVLDVNIC